MKSWGDIINTQLMLFVMMAVGILTAKLGIVTSRARGAITDLVVLVILPCTIAASFWVSFTSDLLVSLGLLLAIGFIIQFICMAFNQFVYRSSDQSHAIPLKYATVCSMASFMGMPVVEGILGAGGVIYSSVYLLPTRITTWSVALAYYTATTGKETLKKVLTHPCVIATVLGLVMMLSGWRPPVFIQSAMSTLGSATTALTMLLVGNIMADVKPRAVFSKLALYFCFIRLFVIPLISLGLALLFRLDPMVAGVAVVLGGMPAGTTTAIFADKYGCDAEFASVLVFLSTLLSMATVPIWAILVGRIF